ncbi:unnamed protein product [Phyllotreta striolata]|uniref:Jumonji domain-containing protein 4 n=1 Tax=Phyllotreta striolata TaxID=444603 RepID=A0A9N9T9C7_PHYSR|nr:unnamed protein product [Phyllotreta striolata]
MLNMQFEIESINKSTLNYTYNIDESLEVLDAKDVSYNYFFQNFMLPNKPCVIKSISEDWNCPKDWIENDKINIKYLGQHYGSDEVTVYDCKERYFNTQKSKKITFKEYLNEAQVSESHVSFPLEEYVKNWHLKLNHTDDNFYEVPIFFASDWLNEFYIENTSDDYRFVYMGSDKTWTPFHVDVFTSYSWSVNVYGKKKWLLFPPGEEEFLKDELGNIPYSILSKNSTSIGDRKYYEVIQHSGEAIFVPAGWHHEVYNLGDTISINHNWINGCNIHSMYRALLSNLRDIKIEIQDCKDMEDFEQHCQIMLNALFGMDLKMFYEFLKFIATKRIRMIENEPERVMYHGHIIGINHILFDLRAIREVLEIFVQYEEIELLDYFSDTNYSPQRLLEEIDFKLKLSD